jgi:CRISPR/Cas system CSM-associated protein Csm3 (group 7 of RAMP superfamily)
MRIASLQHDTTRFELTAVIDTALCIGAGGSTGSLADKPIVRNAEGRLIIPGSHLKGRLRHECEKIASALGLPVNQSIQLQGQSSEGLDSNERPNCIISQIFGNPAQPSNLLVDDLVCEVEPGSLPSEVIRPGVTLSRRRRTAEDQKLYFLETSPANLLLKFTGEIHLITHPLIAFPPYTAALIVAGLKHIRALGGSKSAGLGWLTWQLPNALKESANDTNAWKLLRGESI